MKRTYRLVFVVAITLTALAIGVIAWHKHSATKGLSEKLANDIISEALTDPAYAPGRACINLEGVPRLPASAATEDLTSQKSVVDSLIRNNLIKVNFNVGRGKVVTGNPNYEPIGPGRLLSHIELTEFGRRYYQYDEYDTYDPNEGANVLHIFAKFCAKIKFGGVIKYTNPDKNPFDDNPDPVSWIYFLWQIDSQATPWLADPVLRNRLSFDDDSDEPDGRKGWKKQGIILERDDHFHWGLGKDPYTIRW